MSEFVCPICGNTIPDNSGTFLSLGDAKYLVTCNRCGLHYAHSCMTCRHQQSSAPQCLAEKYHGPLDVIKMVTATQRVGNMVIQQQAPQVNVDVIEQVYPTCPCGTPYNCQRNHVCDNWELRKELLPYAIDSQQIEWNYTTVLG